MTSQEPYIAVVTGGASGLGKAFCEQVAARCSVIYVVDIDFSGAERTASDLSARGTAAVPVQLDVSLPSDVDQLLNTVVARHGRLDIVFNNAGFGIRGPAINVTAEQWKRVFDVNFHGVVNGALAASRLMRKQASGGVIVNTSSLAGLIPVPGIAPYSAAKHAVVGFSLSLADEVASDGVLVCVACPGPLKSSFHQSVATTPGQKQPRCPDDAMSCEAAAREILVAVKKHQRLIVLPGRSRFVWRLYRWFPNLTRWVLGR